MREILFKGKHVDTNEWVYGHYVHQYGADLIYLPDGTDREFGFDCYHIKLETLCQYTGLKDRDDKPIFEGDMLFDLDNECCGTVTYGEWNCSCCKGVFGWALMDGHGDLRDVGFDLRVGGNIHDNPELRRSR